MIIKHVCQTFEAAKDPRIVPINFLQKSEVLLTNLTCPNKSTSQILINLIPLFFFTPFNPIVYSPIRTRTPCWKGVFWGAIRKNGNAHQISISHQLHSPKQHQLMGQSWRNHWNQSSARLGEALHPEVQRGVQRARPMNLNVVSCSLSHQVMLNKDLQTYTHVI